VSARSAAAVGAPQLVREHANVRVLARACARRATQRPDVRADEQHEGGGERHDHNPDTPLLYTLPEAAALLRISRTKLYELLTANEIESIHIGRSRKIPTAALHDYIERLRTEEER
jgi:excisionase family DNA binding protein